MNSYLNDVLKTYKMALIGEELEKYKVKKKIVEEKLKGNFKDNIYNPFNSGSYAKHTAINTKFDLDIILPFKYNSFGTLEDMYENVFNYLTFEFKDEAIIRKQKVSIGLIFHEKSSKNNISLDIVPARETSDSDFEISKNLNLYFNENSGLFSRSSYIKTNISSQIEYIKAKESERKIIRLLKIWKYTNGENYKSFLLELFTIKALENCEGKTDLFQLLIVVLEFIRDNIIKDGFRLIDPGNTNNNILDAVNISDRTSLSNKMNILLNRIAENSENIRSYFPINTDHNTILEEIDKYGLKDSEITPSIPPNSQRFGI